MRRKGAETGSADVGVKGTSKTPLPTYRSEEQTPLHNSEGQNDSTIGSKRGM